MRQEYNKRMARFREIKVAGVSFRQEAVRKCRVGDRIKMIPDPFGEKATEITGNPRSSHNDPDAILLFHPRYGMVGYVPRVQTDPYNRAIRAGGPGPSPELFCIITAVLGGEAGKNTFGLRVVPALAELR